MIVAALPFDAPEGQCGWRALGMNRKLHDREVKNSAAAASNLEVKVPARAHYLHSKSRCVLPGSGQDHIINTTGPFY